MKFLLIVSGVPRRVWVCSREGLIMAWVCSREGLIVDLSWVPGLENVINGVSGVFLLLTGLD